MDHTVKNRFDNASKAYVTEKYFWRYQSACLVSKLVCPEVSDIILDIGCGTGKQIIELSGSVKLCIGIDISDGMVGQAVENALNENRDNVKFYTGTFDEPERNINLMEMQLTKIISNYALHHLNLKEKQHAITKMVDIGGQSLQTIVIGDLMFFENPLRYKDEFNAVGYGPGSDTPSTVEELIECFANFPFKVEMHKLHPLAGVLVANRRP